MYTHITESYFFLIKTFFLLFVIVKLCNTKANTKSNAELLQVCKTTDIPSFVLKQQMSYLGHLACQSNKCLTKRLLFNDDKRSKQGHPFETVEDKVLKNSNLTKDQFYKNTMNMKNDDHPN